MCQIKAPIAGNSKAIAKIGNVELAHFTKQVLIHELIRGSLSYCFYLIHSISKTNNYKTYTNKN